MVRLIVASFEFVVECIVVLVLAASAFGGYWYFEDPIGIAAGVLIAFVFIVLFIAPFLVLSDIRRTLVRLEAIAAKPDTQHSTKTALPQSQTFERREPRIKTD